MRKFFASLICFLFVIILCGCNNEKEYEKLKEKYNSNSNSEVNDSSNSEYYKVELKEETKIINSDLTTKIVRAVVSNDSNKEATDRINNFLNTIVDDSYSQFEEYLNEDSKADMGYIFDYEYSLLNQNDKYLIFKLDFKWQAGGPYPTYAEEYYMFHKDNGKVVYFDELFTDTDKVMNLVYDDVVSQINEIYEKYDSIYSAEDNELKKALFNKPGLYVLNGSKLSFSLPKGYVTAVAFGSMVIDVDENLYKAYIK